MRCSHLMTAATHQIYDAMLRVARRRAAETELDERDRGAVSLEQVLWFVAAGVSVAVVAGIMWAAIKEEADTDIVQPAAP